MKTHKPKLFVSVSGGKTSGYMAKKLKEEYSDLYEMIFGFANTGKERHETLVFTNQLDKEFGLELVWVEAVVHPKLGEGTTHKVVTFETASRKGEPFVEVIKKYGIPNQAFPHCTRELKLAAIHSYLRSVGWEIGSYVSAVGIRADELKRLRKDAVAAHIVYPLAHWFPTTKPEINDWWEEQSFRLQLAEYEGNCDNCWKKGTPKLIRLAQERPESFDWWRTMEQSYALAGAGHGVFGDENPRTFFRKGMNTEAIFELAKISTIRPTPPDPDEDSGCSESCEVFGEENENNTDVHSNDLGGLSGAIHSDSSFSGNGTGMASQVRE